MSRHLAALVLLFLAAGCGGPDESPGSPGPAPQPPAPAPGAFGLETAPAIRVTGDPAGVTVTIRRAEDPADLLPALADPEFDPGPDTPWEQIASVPAGADGRVRLPPLPVGLFEVVAARGDDRSRAVFASTDLLVVVDRSADEVLVYAAEAETGRPLARATVVAGGPGGRIEGTTDATGVFRRALAPEGRVAVLVGSEDRLGTAVVGPVEPPAAAPDLLVVTDRPGARPGETVRFATLARRPDGPLPEAFEVTDERGLRLATGPVEDGSGTFRIPPEAGAGIATLALRGEGARGEAKLRVLPRGDPPITLSLRGPDRAVREDEVRLEIGATFAGGLPAAGATVSYRAWREGKPGVPALAGDAVLDATGTLRTRFVPTEAGGWIVSATAEDGLGSTASAERRILVGDAALELRLEPATRWIRSGAVLEAGLSVRYPDGGDLPVTVEVRAGGRIETVECGPGPALPLSFPDLTAGRVALMATARDAAGRTARAEAEVRVLDGDDGIGPTEIVVVPDRETYAPGETAKVLVELPLALEGANILSTLVGDRLGPHAVETFSGRSHVFEARIPAGIGERVTFAVTAIADGKVRRGAATVRVGAGDGALRVEVEPGEGGVFLRVRSAGGEPEAARAVVRVTAGDDPVAFEAGLAIPPEGLDLPLPESGAPEGGRVEALVVTADGRSATAGADRPAPPPPPLRLFLPPFLVRGDVAVLRATAVGDGNGDLRFETEELFPMSPLSVPLALPAEGGPAVAELTVSARRSGTARVTAELRAGGEPVTETGEIDVVPRARVRSETGAGVTTDGKAAGYAEVPVGFSPDATSLALHLGAGPVAAVLRSIARGSHPVEGDAEAVLAGFLPGELAAALLGEWQLELSPDLADHDARTREGLVALAGRQRPDGGFGYRAGGDSDPEATARIVSGIARLREAGVDIAEPDLAAAIARLDAALASGLADRDPAAAVRAVRARFDATGEAGDRLTGLVKVADRLPPDAAADLARVLSRTGDRARASEILAGLGLTVRRLPRGASRWDAEDPVLATAAVVRTLALSEAPGAEVLVERGVRFLLDSRRGAGWGSPRRDTAVASTLLAVARIRGRPAAQPIGVRIRVGDAIAGSIRLDAEDLTILGVTVDVPGDYFRAGRNRIGIEAAGTTRLDWSYRLLVGSEPEHLTSESKGISITRETRVVLPERGGFRLVPTGSPVARGGLLLTSVVLTSEVPRRGVTVTVPTAGGARPVSGDAARVDPSWSEPEGLRTRLSDRAASFFLPVLGPEPVRLLILSRATASGRFTTLPAEARLVEDPGVFGASAEEILYVE